MAGKEFEESPPPPDQPNPFHAPRHMHSISRQAIIRVFRPQTESGITRVRSITIVKFYGPIPQIKDINTNG